MQEMDREIIEEGVIEMSKRMKYIIQDFIDAPRGADIILCSLVSTLHDVIYCIEDSERCKNAVIDQMEEWDFDD